MMYFVLLGSHVSFSVPIHWGVVAIFLLIIMVIKPYLIMWLMSFMGHTKKNDFFTGVSLGQMSEFSFIILSMGISSGVIKDTTLVTTLTIA